MINIKNVVHNYTTWDEDGREGKKLALKNVSLDIEEGKFIAILGSNGSGKSTLAKHLNVLLLPDEGTIWIDGKDTRIKEKLWDIRTEVGMVFQNPDNQIVGASVEEDVAFGPENKCLSSEVIQERVTNSLEVVGLLHKRESSPSRLSGGQKQRLALASVLAVLPKCIVLDEPTAMLDPRSRKEVIDIIGKLNKENGITIILITHHTDEVVGADEIFLMQQGEVVGQGSPKEIFSNLRLLKQIKMDVPQVTELAARLRDQGIPINLPVLTEKQFIEEMERVFEKDEYGKGGHKNDAD